MIDPSGKVIDEDLWREEEADAYYEKKYAEEQEEEDKAAYAEWEEEMYKRHEEVKSDATC